MRDLLTGPQGRLGRLALGVSALSGLAQVGVLRELSANQAFSSVGLAVRLLLGVVLVAYGLGAALAPRLERVSERRLMTALGTLLGAYLLLFLLGLLLALEPSLPARAVEPLRLLALGAAAAPPFVIYGLVLARLGGEVQARMPRRMGAWLALTLVGTLLGLAGSAAAARWVGVNSLVVFTAVASLPVLLDRARWLAPALLLVVALPVESGLEGLRERRPDFHQPVGAHDAELVYSGWSPYQKVDLYRYQDDVLLGVTNGFWQWWSAPSARHPQAYPGYDVLYGEAWVRGRDVLVIGSGAGMGLLHLEAREPRSITAVELDPLVVELSRDRFARFNGGIYQRVPVHAAEGRAFLEASKRRYGLIVYEGSFLTSAHARVAVTAENHLYTREGIRTALARLRPGGLGLVLFAGPDRAFERVRRAVEDEGAHTERLRLHYPGSLWWDLPVLVFGRRAEDVRPVARAMAAAAGPGRLVAPPVDRGDERATSDARPFLYAGGPGEQRLLWSPVGGAAAVLAVALLAPGRRRVRGYYFVLGAAFMLVQQGLIAQLRSFFGDPVSTAYTALVLLLLGMAFGSQQLPRWLALGAARRRAAALAAVGCGAAAWLALPHDAALAAWPLRVLWAALALLPLGAVLGVFFPLGLRGQPAAAVPAAWVWDAIGTAAGFFLFHALALGLGLPAALAAGALLYLTAWGLLARA